MFVVASLGAWPSEPRRLHGFRAREPAKVQRARRRTDDGPKLMGQAAVSGPEKRNR